MTKLAPEWVQTSDPVIRSPACYRWTTAPALMEEEVITPPRGGSPAPVTQRRPGGVRAVPQLFTGVRPREGGPNRHKDVESPVDRLVDTVDRMQVDLADLRAENRMLKTPRVPRSPVHLDRRRSQRLKCHSLMEQRVGNNINRFSTRL